MRTLITRARVRLSLCLLGTALGTVVLAGACGGSDDGGSQTGVDLLSDIYYGGETAEPDVQEAPDDVPTKPDTVLPDTPVNPVMGRLEFVDRNGDDGVSCVDSNRCSKKIESVEVRPLQVRYFEDDARAPHRAIEYEITRGPAIANLEPRNGIQVTDEDGEATVQFRVTELESALAQLEVTVRVPSNPDVPELHFDILVDIKGGDEAPLTVLPDYVGDQPVDSVKVKLFRQPPDPRNAGQYLLAGRSCTELVAYIKDDDEIHMPAADILSSEARIGGSFKFEEVHFTDLAGDPEQMFTVLAVGQDANRVNRIVGCDDQNALVRYEESITVVVPMVDLPPRLKGQYEVRSEFDLVSALPDDVEQVVDYILDFFDDPALTVIRILCDVGQDFTEDLCGFIMNDNGTPNTTGTIVIGILNGIIEGLGQGNWFGTTLDVGADIGRMLRELTFLSTMEFSEEPDEDGWIDPRTTGEDWHGFRYRWTLDIGPACADDPTCGWVEYDLARIVEGGVTAEFEASVNTAQEGTDPPWSLLTVEEHPLTIKYGALLNWIIQDIVLPRLAGGEPPDGLPRVDTYEELIKAILAGRECLREEQLAGCPNCCCQEFAVNVIGDADIPMAENLVIAACDAVVQFGAGYIENLLLGLDLQTGDPEAENAFVIGTMPGAPCRIYDTDQNLEIDAFGHESNPCMWQVRIRVNLFGGTDIYVDAAFFGCRSGTGCRL